VALNSSPSILSPLSPCHWTLVIIPLHCTSAMSSIPIDQCEFLDIKCSRDEGPIWFCVDCQTSLCEPCWPRLLSHSNGRTGRDGLPHEKVKRDVYEKLKQILDPMYTEAELEELHRQDLDTTWFGQYYVLLSYHQVLQISASRVLTRHHRNTKRQQWPTTAC
jgi:hypothetical protein